MHPVMLKAMTAPGDGIAERREAVKTIALILLTSALALGILVEPLDGARASIAAPSSSLAASSGVAAHPLFTASGLDTVSFANDAVGCAGGHHLILCTKNGGKRWRATWTAPGLVSQLQFSDVQHVWALVSDRLLHSNDGGVHWQYSRDKSRLSSIDFPSAQIGWGVTTNGRFVTTTNGGRNLTAEHTPFTVRAVSFLDRRHGWAYQTDGHIAFTENAGRTWHTRGAIGLGASWTYGDAQLTFVTASRGWLLLTLGSGCGSMMPYLLYYTADGGVHWRQRFVGPAACGGKGYPTRKPGVPGYPGNLSAFPSGHAFFSVVAPAQPMLYVVSTHDAGRHWAQGAPTGQKVAGVTLAMAFVSATQGWLVTGGEAARSVGRIIHTTDGGRTWQTQLLVH
ncbi:MAG: hypothetical protein M3Z66_12920 [Chloroflexota bacterium]|nr:hypothetical protein [Chloroflexota bacterium]